MQMFEDLNGKVAIVTGAGGRIGSETALLLGEAGMRVVLADLDESRLESVANSMRERGVEVATAVGDIALERTAQELVGVAVASFGRLDVLDNNAADTSLSAVDR